jgi:Leucine-rich repeat (LRR) protein
MLIKNLENVDNKIFEIRQMITELIKLETVSIKCTNLNIIDKVFFDFKNLSQIILIKNNLTELKTDTFKDLPALRILHLSHNRIKTIQSGSFNNLPSLTMLILSYNLMDKNSIKNICKDSFRDFEKLKYLNLSGNTITKIDKEAFINGKDRHHQRFYQENSTF